MLFQGKILLYYHTKHLEHTRWRNFHLFINFSSTIGRNDVNMNVYPIFREEICADSKSYTR